MRDRDANTAWATASADGVLEERRVYCQNWRGDVSAVITDTGKMVEWVKYSAYGVAMGLPCGDTDSNCIWDATDSAAITGTLDARKDCNLDGAVSAADVTHANSITGGYQTLGRTVLTSASVANRKGYAGYENDGCISDQYHVRYRVYRPTLGRWIRRDPIGYVEGANPYEYASASPLPRTDPVGLLSNWDFILHYYFGDRTPWDITSTYRTHPQVLAYEAGVMNAEDARCNFVAKSMLSRLDCNCPSSTGYYDYRISPKTGKKNFGDEFIMLPQTPYGGIWNFGDWVDSFLATDWTFSVGRNSLKWRSHCYAVAFCADVDNDQIAEGSYLYNVVVDFDMRDAFTDPTDIGQNLKSRLGKWGEAIWIAIETLLSLPPYDGWTGSPFKFYATWSSSMFGGGQMPKSKQGCNGEE